MSITYSGDIRTSRMNAVLSGVDDALTPGKLVIGTAGMVTDLIVFDLSDPAGSVTGDVLTLTAGQFSDAVAGGVAADAEIRDGDGNVKVSGFTIGGPGSGAHIELDSLTITTGKRVELVSAAITHFTGA